MAITAALVKELRDKTGAGMMDAKKALTETDGDMDAAVDWLRTKRALPRPPRNRAAPPPRDLWAVRVEGNKGVSGGGEFRNRLRGQKRRIPEASLPTSREAATWVDESRR